MKCSTCGKEIPETSKVCPFCYATIVKEEATNNINNTSNLTTIKINQTTTGQSSELNFGELSNTSYDSNTLSIGEGKKKKNYGLIIVVSVVLVVGIIIAGLIFLNQPKVYPYQYYVGVVDEVYKYFDDNLISADASNNGSYKLYYLYKDVNKEFKGDYKFDVHKKVIRITGELKDPQEERGGVVVGDLTTMHFELIGEDSNIYFKSDDVYSSPILLPYEDDIGLFATKQYDLDALIDGEVNALKKSLKELDYEVTKKATIDGYQENSLEKISIKVDYKTKSKFLTTYYKTLLDDSNFISEYAKIKGRKDEDIEKIFNNYRLTYEHKYSIDDGELAYVDLYHKGKEVVRIEITDVKNNKKMQFNIKKNQVEFTKYENNEKISKISISRVDTTMNDKITRNYKIDIEDGDFEIELNLELKKEDNTSVRINGFDNYKSIREFTQEELNGIKTSIKPYIVDVDWVDKLPKTFGTKCTKDLTCVCDTKACSCELNDKIIECPLGSVKDKNNLEAE